MRIVLADDQAMVRDGLALVLSAEPDFDVVERCADGRALVQAVTRLSPDLVLTDVRMRGVDGIEAIGLIRQLVDGPPVLALTTFDDDEVLWPVLGAGADGFVLKDSPAETLVEAARAVAGGGAWLDPRVLPRVMQRAAAQPTPAAEHVRALASLTAREEQVLELMRGGANNAEIARALRSAETTVKSQVSSVLQKLGARDRAAAIVIAYESGWRRNSI